MDARLHRFSLHFRDAALERRYREATNPRTQRAGRVAAVGGLVFTVVPAILLIAFAPEEWVVSRRYMVNAGLLVSGMFFAAWALSHTPRAQRSPQAFNVGFTGVMTLVISLMLLHAPQEFVAHRGFLPVALQTFAAIGLLRMRILPAVAACLLSGVVYLTVVDASGMLGLLDFLRQSFWLTMFNVWGLLVAWQLDVSGRREFVAMEQAEGLLRNILPEAIAQQLKASPGTIAEHADEVTVLFADIVGFTPLSATKRPADLVALLDRVFTEFDRLAQQHGLEKIKTIGDAYMAVAGLPHARAGHAVSAARMALDMVDSVRAVGESTGEPLVLRVGLHSGPVVAGVIGRSKFSYDLWGDTVNTASRMESTSPAGAVQCTPETAALLRGHLDLHARGAIDVKGKGMMETYLLAARPWTTPTSPTPKR